MYFFKPLLFLSLIFIYGCSSSTVINSTLSTSEELNPDLSGRASPIVVHIYELKNIGGFESADFYSLLDNPKATLGNDLVNSVSFHLNPDEIQTYNKTISPDIHYFAVIAAYRNLDHAVWRDHITITSSKTNNLMIHLNKLNISIIKIPQSMLSRLGSIFTL